MSLDCSFTNLTSGWDNDKSPALVMVHGKPGGQARFGYGKAFLKAGDRRHGDEDLADCVEAKKFLETLGTIDTCILEFLNMHLRNGED